MISRTILPSVLTIVLTSLVGCEEFDSTPIPPKRASGRPRAIREVVMEGTMSAVITVETAHATPEAAFQELQTALNQDNFQRAAKLLTSKSQAALAGALLFEMGLAVANDDEQSNTIEKIFAAFVTEEQEQLTDNNQTANAAGTFRAMGSRVNNKPRFIAAVLKTLPESPIKQLLPKGELNNLKIEEDFASGIVADLLAVADLPDQNTTENSTDEADGMELEANTADTDTSSESTDVGKQIQFRKVNEGWRILLPDEAFEEVRN